MTVTGRSESPVVGMPPASGAPGTARLPGDGSSPAAPARLLLEQGLGFRLSRLTRMLRAEWTRELARLDLTPPQAAVLRGVAGRPGCSLRALAGTLGAEPMTAKRCVDDLERRSLVQSAHRGADRRSRALELTSEGLALAARIDILVRAQERRLDAVLGPARRSRLEEALGALESDLGLPQVPATPPRQERP